MDKKLAGAILWVCLVAGMAAGQNVVLFEDQFDSYHSGMFSAFGLGAHAEYHYVPVTAQPGPWQVSCFTGDNRDWKLLIENGKTILYQQSVNKKANYTHNMVDAGDPLWRNYAVTVRFAPETAEGRCGVEFRVRNDRCYYFAGVDGPRAVLLKVHHATAYHKPGVTVLGEAPFAYAPGEYITLTAAAEGDQLRAEIEGGPVLEAEDGTFTQGKIGLTADAPARFARVQVRTGRDDLRLFLDEVVRRDSDLERLQASNPQPLVWKKIGTAGFGTGRNLRFGDLDGDGQIDVLICQMLHHGPKDTNSEVGCLTAMTFDGKKLWQVGEPDPWGTELTNDVAFQIHDIDGDGKNEVVYCKDFQIVVADGATGKTKFKAPTPESPTPPPGAAKKPQNRFDRILGDSIYFCDLRGLGAKRDMILKDRYTHVWAYTDTLELLWDAEVITGHYPFAYDTDGDGKDELAVGYTLFDDDGTVLWTLQDKINDHADGVSVVRMEPGAAPLFLNAASDEGFFIADLQGNILKHHYIGHAQNPAVANFRDDLPGLEIVSVNFWGNQGIFNFYDSKGDIYHDAELVNTGSMCLPVNWTGKTEEFFVISPNVEAGGMFDGWGRCAVKFPGDGHPDLCNAVLDIMGDCRDEIVVWDPYEIWVYTQDDNPKTGELYNPKKNELFNYSNYWTGISLPSKNTF